MGMFKDKRGLGIDSIYPIVITIVLIGVLLGVGFLILGEFTSSVPAVPVTTTNESVNATGSFGKTGALLGAARVPGFSSISITSCRNRSLVAGHAVVINSGNYTVNQTTGRIFTTKTASTAPWINKSKWNCTYTYNKWSEASLATNSTLTGLAKFPTWIAIIVVVIAAAIILSIVLSNFAGAKSGV